MATHSSTLSWKIPWTEEPGGLQSMGSPRVGHDWATSLSRIGEGNVNPLQCSCLENPRDEGAWWAAVYGVAQSQTRLKWLSSSSLSICSRLHLVLEIFIENSAAVPKTDQYSINTKNRLSRQNGILSKHQGHMKRDFGKGRILKRPILPPWANYTRI